MSCKTEEVFAIVVGGGGDEAPLERGFSLNAALGLDERKRFEVRTLFRLGQTVELIKRKATANFDPPVILLHRFCRRGVRPGVRWNWVKKSRIDSASNGCH